MSPTQDSQQHGTCQRWPKSALLHDDSWVSLRRRSWPNVRRSFPDLPEQQDLVWVGTDLCRYVTTTQSTTLVYTTITKLMLLFIKHSVLVHARIADKPDAHLYTTHKHVSMYTGKHQCTHTYTSKQTIHIIRTTRIQHTRSNTRQHTRTIKHSHTWESCTVKKNSQ